MKSTGSIERIIIHVKRISVTAIREMSLLYIASASVPANEINRPIHTERCNKTEIEIYECTLRNQTLNSPRSNRPVSSEKRRRAARIGDARRIRAIKILLGHVEIGIQFCWVGPGPRNEVCGRGSSLPTSRAAHVQCERWPRRTAKRNIAGRYDEPSEHAASIILRSYGGQTDGWTDE